MINNMFKRYYWVLVLLSFTFGACEKVTDQAPVSEFTQESFWKNAESAASGTAAIYDRLQTAMGSGNSNVVVHGDARADLFTLGTGGLTQASLLAVVNNDLASSNDYAAWDDYYRTILQANLVLKYVPKISDPTLTAALRDRYIGEASFVRALCYFYIVRLWGNAPLFTQPVSSPTDNFKLPKTSKEVILDTIENDLNRALTRVPAITTDFSTRLRANVAGARSLLTDVYLWRGKNQQAADMASLVINDPQVKLATRFSDMFHPVATTNPFPDPIRNNQEFIFQVHFSNLQLDQLNEISRMFLVVSNSGNHRLAPSTKLQSSFETGDTRSISTWNGDQIVKFRGSSQTINPALRFHDNNIIVYRLADIILMRAEALAKINTAQSRADAVSEYNKVRNRAFVQPAGSPSVAVPATITAASTSDEIIDAILLERMRELTAEGKRWFDLVRNNKVMTTPGVNGVSGSNELLWPIADDEIRLYNDPSFQNPGYQ
jgi:starch-binding outer membrane protein, SusD/RagB family